MLKAIGIFTIASIGRTPGWLDVGHIPRLWTENTQERSGIEGPRAFFHIVGLLDDTTLLGPVILQSKDQFLKSHKTSRPDQRQPYSWVTSTGFGIYDHLSRQA